ncbi:MAG: hypothetical protein ACTSRZ_09115 [Promethearchaeota archaeon]
MCEFKILKLGSDGKSTEKIAEDIMFMKYNPETGESIFADILGRKFNSKNAYIVEINMFESRHDITIVENELVPLFSKLIYEMNLGTTNAKEIGKKLIESIKNKLNL